MADVSVMRQMAKGIGASIARSILRFMITELGHFALILAFMVAIVQTIVPL